MKIKYYLGFSRYRIKRFIRLSYYFIMSLLSLFLFTFNVSASTLIDLELGNVISFNCNDTWSINESYTNYENNNIRQVRRTKGCYIKKPDGYDLLVIQPSFNLTYNNQNIDINNLNYIDNTSILHFNTRVFINHNGNTRYCQQEDTYSICNIADIPQDIDQYISVIIGFDVAFNNLSYFGSTFQGTNQAQYISGNVSISPLIQYGRLYNGSKASLSVIDDSINRNAQEQMNYNENNISQPDSSNSQNFENGVDNIMENFDNINYNDVNIYNDSYSNNWVWNTLFLLVGSHNLLSLLLVSILSIGIIKQVLGR